MLITSSTEILFQSLLVFVQHKTILAIELISNNVLSPFFNCLLLTSYYMIRRLKSYNQAFSRGFNKAFYSRVDIRK